MSSGLIKAAALDPPRLNGAELLLPIPKAGEDVILSRGAAALVVLPVFLQAPWVRLHPFSAGLFSFLLLGVGILLGMRVEPAKARWGALLVGFSGSWLAGTLFWGWLRAHPLLHLPIEALALPLALTGLQGRWRLGCSFYLASLVGTTLTDLAMALTGVMRLWPAVVEAPIEEAQPLLQQAALTLSRPTSLAILLAFTGLILLIARTLRRRGRLCPSGDASWGVASAVLITTLMIDGLFLLTALIQPRFSGLI